MSLRTLFESTAVALNESSIQNSALVFVLNSEFVPGLRVLLYSMYANKTLLDLPILIITEQEEVLSDSVISQVADHKRLISAGEISSFSSIPSRKVPSQLRLAWIPKYTFLKWMMFDEYGYERLLFIDADIVCMKPIDSLLTMEDADLYGCPMFTREMIAPHLDADTISQNILSFAMCERPKSKRLNTGVLVIGRKLLSPSFRADLIKFAEAQEFANEQSALRNFLRRSRRGDLRMISPLYNFKTSFLEAVCSQRKFELIEKIRLLHFAGEQVRPWQKSAPETLADYVWFCYAKEAEEVYKVLV
jgi:lipopolysaccharide biosynthesis glycosyltransferase